MLRTRHIIPMLLRVVAISVLSFVLWKFLRPFVVKSPLANIAGPPKTSWWKGNLHQIFDHRGWKFHYGIVEKYGGAVKLHALFGDEQLYVSDPRAIYHIVVKDQDFYEMPSMSISSNTLLFGRGLLATLGDQHKRQRKMLNPVFSMNHMRALLHIFYPVAHQLRDVIKQQMLRNLEGEVDLLEWMSLAALEVIGQGAMGYSFQGLGGNGPNRYSRATSELGPTMFKLTVWRQFLPYITKLGSPSLRRKILEWIPSPTLQKVKDTVDIMSETSHQIYAEKKDGYINSGFVPEHVLDGKDLMSVLLRANQDADKSDKLSEEEVIAQMNTFIFAGHSTTTHAICRTIHQLALHPEVQTQLREEITQARQQGDVCYEDLMSLPFLDAVCRETLRMFPPAPFVIRTTRKDIVLPLLWPIKSADGKSDISEIPLKNNTNVFVSILAANRSKAIWGDDAEEWKPDRWLKPLAESVSAAHLPGVYSSMMTFLGGGRACIGFKFAEMETKVMLSVLLEAYEFSNSHDVYWNLSGLEFPSLASDPQGRPQFPIRVVPVQGA